jgi:hypothetical protein
LTEKTYRPARSVSSLAQLELLQGDPALGREIARQVLSDARALGDSRREAEALLALALATHDDEATDRVALLEEGLAVARAAGVNGLVARHLGLLGAVAAEAGDLRSARSLLGESVGLGSMANDPVNVLTTTVQLGWLAVAEDRLDDAESHFNRFVDLEARWGGKNYGPALFGLGLVNLRRGETERARGVYRRLLLNLQESAPDSAPLADALVYIAAVDVVDGQHERAQRLMGANEAWHAARGKAGRRWFPNLRGPLQRGLVPVPPAPADRLLVQAYQEGRAMSLADATAYALELTHKSL